MKSFKILLFGLTGFGSYMLRYLVDIGMDVRQVFTRSEKMEHPYYPVRSVDDICLSYGIPCSHNAPKKIAEADIDLIICATYNRLLKKDFLETARLGAFNFHPSLLPAYKGTNPMSQCLLDGETVTGMTVHKMREEVDSGKIIAQRRLTIEPWFDNGMIRQRLALIQYPLLLDLLSYLEGEVDTFVPDGSVQPSVCSQFAPPDVTYHPDMSILSLSLMVRACSPFPGLNFSVGQNRYRVAQQISFTHGEFGLFCRINGSCILIGGREGRIKLIGEKQI